MTIKKYELSDAVSEQSLKSGTENNAIMAQASGDEPTIPFFDFINQLSEGTWQGGKVNGLGYVGKDEFEKTNETGDYPDNLYYSGLITRFIHSSEIDLEAQLSTMYSMMYVPTIPNSSSYPENNGNGNNSQSSQNDLKHYQDSITFENVKIDYEVVIVGLYVVATFYMTKNFNGYSGITIKCRVGPTNNSISEILFDGTKTSWIMNKTCIGTKAYQKDAANQCLMSLEFYLGGSLRFTASIG